MAIWTRYSQTMDTSNQYVKFRLVATLNSQSVTSNTSSVTVKMQVWRTNSGYTTYGSGTAYVTINGSQYTASIDSADKFTYNSYTEVFSKTVSVPHSSDGSKTLSMVGDIAHSQFSASAQSWSTTLDTIPRTSKPSLSDIYVFLRDETVTINTNRASSSFTHTITYTFGDVSGTIATGVGTSTTWTPPISLASQIPSSTYGAGRIYCKTYSGSTYIGQESIQVNLYVPNDIYPSVSGLAVSIAGTGVDDTIGKYVQGMSKAWASFSGSGTYGSTISAKSLTFKRQSDGGNKSTVNNYSGTSSTLTLSGVYQVTAWVRDSRGREKSSTLTFTVEAYSPPNITSFSVSRTTAGSTTVSITRNATWTSMGGANDLTTIRVRKIPLGGAWADVESTSSTSTTGSTTSTFTNTGNDLTKSYTFEFYVQDTLGNSSTATRTISTAQYPLSIKSNIGVGVGKIWERGALDVGGETIIPDLRIKSTFGQEPRITKSTSSGRDFVQLLASSGGYANGGAIYMFGQDDPSYPNDVWVYSDGEVRMQLDDKVNVLGNLDISGQIENQSPISLPLYGGWTFYGGSFAPPTYWKDKNGVVHLEGLLRAGTTTGGTMVAQLPGGYRPRHNLIITAMTSVGTRRIDIKESSEYGRIILTNTDSMSWLSLDGISFLAEY